MQRNWTKACVCVKDRSESLREASCKTGAAADSYAKSKQPTFAQPSSVRTKASDFNHWLLKAPELGQPRLHTTSGSWPVQRQPGKEKMLLPARHSFYKSFASLPAVSAVGQFCVAGPNSPALRALTLPDRLLPCFWLLILDASFVPLHVHKHLRPSRRPSESS
jgi:hypothetical protein